MTDLHPTAEALLSVIRHKIVHHPRGLQKEIGPSEIGHPCERWMAYKMTGFEPVNAKRASWRPTVGVAVHEWLAQTFQEADARVREATGIATPFWIVENKVAVGKIEGPDGYEVYGSCDLYYAPEQTVVDWKIVGKTTLDDARRHGASEQYRVQGQAYGRGWMRAGFPVKDIAVFFLPASGELGDAVFCPEPYDEGMVTEALQRISVLQEDVRSQGLAATLPLLATADHYCHNCPYWRMNSQDLMRGCPGDEGTRVNQKDSLHQLIDGLK